MNECPKIISRLCCASLSFWLLNLGLTACTTLPKSELPQVSPVEGQNPSDLAFSQLSQAFMEEYLAMFPDAASTFGDHRRDAEWGDYSKAGKARTQAFYQKYSAALQKIDPQTISPDNQVDHAILTNEVAGQLFALEHMPALQRSATAFVSIISQGLDTLISHEYGTPEARTQALTQRLLGLPKLVAAAKERLENPSKIDTETAILQTAGLIELCDTGIKPLLQAVPDQATELSKAAALAKVAIDDLKNHLQTVVLPRSNRDFRIGKELYAHKMQYDLVDSIQPEQLARNARVALDKTLLEMYQVALKLSPELLKKTAKPSKDPKTQRQLVRAVLNKLAEDQPTDATLFSDAEQAIASATAFIREKNIMTIPDETCKVIRMPTFNAGVAGAYSLSSGPFDTKFENFIALEPPSAEERASFYREYNKSMLIELMLHEAVPGHCLQAMHAVKTPHPLRAVFGNGPYAEGWAMYSEEVMAQHGFGGLRIKIMQLKLLARAISNTIIDYEVHTQNMSEEQAMHLMMEVTFQEKAEATGKWRRVQLTAVQLTTYFYGYQQFYAMRQAAEKQAGFNEKTFHDQLLGSGAPPMKLLRTRFGL